MRGKLQGDGTSHGVAHDMYRPLDVTTTAPLFDGCCDRACMSARGVVTIARRRRRTEPGQVERQGRWFAAESLHQGNQVERGPAESVDHDHGRNPLPRLADMDLARPEGPTLSWGNHHPPMGPREARRSTLDH